MQKKSFLSENIFSKMSKKLSLFQERQEQQKKERQIILEKKNQQAKEKGKGFKDQRAKLEKADALKKEEMKRYFLIVNDFLKYF